MVSSYRVAIVLVTVAFGVSFQQASGSLLPSSLAEQALADLPEMAPAKRGGVDACSCCANKHLFFCCGACMRQRGATLGLEPGDDRTPAARQETLRRTAALRTLRNTICACCRGGDDRFSKCCQRCLALDSLAL